jgi:hypothetical protein
MTQEGRQSLRTLSADRFVSSVLATLALLLATIMAWGIAAYVEMLRRADSVAISRNAAIGAPWLLDVLVMTGATGMAVLATIRATRHHLASGRQEQWCRAMRRPLT